MTKYLAMSAALVLATGPMVGAAFAQDETAPPATTTYSPTPGYVTDRTRTQSERIVDSNGAVIDKSSTVQSGNGTLSAQSKETVRQPDGVQQQRITTSQERTNVVPVVPPPVASTTTTTRTVTSSTGYPN